MPRTIFCIGVVGSSEERSTSRKRYIAALLPSRSSSSDSIGDLIHLRYLALRNGNMSKLPSSVGKLRSLQTLIAIGSFDWKLPSKICKLTQLRHLVARSHGCLQINSLTQLQTLKYTNFEQWVKLDVTNLSKLRELEIRRIFARSSLDSLAKLRNLRSLALQADNGFPPLPLLSHSENLLKLKLDGKIQYSNEDCHKFPDSLRILILHKTKLRQTSMQILGRLPNLTLLELAYDAYLDNEMVCNESGFPQLEVLRLSWLQNLEILQVDDEVMPKLRSFSIEDCNKIIEVPRKLRTLPIWC